LNRGYAKGGRAGFEHGNKVERPSKKFEKKKVTVDPAKVRASNEKYRDWNKARRDKTFGGKRIPKKGPVIRERQTPPSPTVRAPEAQGGKKLKFGSMITDTKNPQYLNPFKKGGKADKKWMQKVSASIKKRGTKGKCTPITKPGCTGRAKALAKTFKKIAAKRKAKG
jgi:hypothetical protein